MTLTVRPFLMFEGSAEAAINLYLSVFDDCRLLDIQRYGPGGPGPEGSVAMATFQVGDLTVMANDSFVKHAFTFTPSVSLFAILQTEAQVDEIAARLAEGGGAVLMPPGNYGFSRRFAWVNDRFGVSWQLNLPATPDEG